MTPHPEHNATHEDTVLSGEELDALLAGTEGIEGEWQLATNDETIVVTANLDAEGNCGVVADVLSALGPAKDADIKHAAHIARCDPDTIRKLVTEVKASRSHSRASG